MTKYEDIEATHWQDMEFDLAEKKFLSDRQKAFEKSIGVSPSRSESSERALEQLDHNISPNPLD